MFDRETIIHAAAVLFVLCTISFIVALSLRIWQKRPRKAQQTLTVTLTAGTAELCAAFEALERVIATLEQDETYQREQALGNEVVRLGYSVVTEGEQVLEQYQARLAKEQEG